MNRVIKVGGRAQGAVELPSVLRTAHQRGERLCLVHGGGDEVTSLQRALGQEPRFVNGRRATTDEELLLVRMVLSGTVNKRLVAWFADAGIPSAGISGEDGNLLRCELFANGELGAVGVPAHTDPALPHALQHAGFLPVISPLGRLQDGRACNVNGDDAAAAIAVALGADELLLVADVPGVLDAAGTLVPMLDQASALALIDSGVARGGMIAKLEAALRSLAHGVTRVRIGDVSSIADLGGGTVLHQTRP